MLNPKDGPGCNYAVIDDYNGYLINIKSVEDIVESVSKLVKDPSLVVRMGTNSRKRVDEEFSITKINDKMLGVFELVGE